VDIVFEHLCGFDLSNLHFRRPENTTPMLGTITIDSLSFDDLVSCIKQLEAREASKAACVCHEWRLIVFKLGPYFLQKAQNVY
jgi:hypothetical protein